MRIVFIPDIPKKGPELKTDMSKVAPGAHIKANCTSTGSFPEANITWFLNDLEVSYICLSVFVRRHNRTCHYNFISVFIIPNCYNKF